MKKRFKILAVDDDAVNLKLIKSRLQAEYEIITALNGYDAISLVKAENPDLILLDVMMPDMDGFEVCNLLKSDVTFGTIPIIFLTALDSTAGETHGLSAGGIDYLTKPLNFDLLKLRVHNHLDLKAKSDLVIEQRNLLEKQKADLESMLTRVKRLEGIIPICMYCKNIRNDAQDWERLEEYLIEHTDAQLSHGICPTCKAEKFPQYGNK